MEKLRVPREPPERPPFDLDAAVFLADFAFEAYRVSQVTTLDKNRWAPRRRLSCTSKYVHLFLSNRQAKATHKLSSPTILQVDYRMLFPSLSFAPPPRPSGADLALAEPNSMYF